MSKNQRNLIINQTVDAMTRLPLVGLNLVFATMGTIAKDKKFAAMHLGYALSEVESIASCVRVLTICNGD